MSEIEQIYNEWLNIWNKMDDKKLLEEAEIDLHHDVTCGCPGCTDEKKLARMIALNFKLLKCCKKLIARHAPDIARLEKENEKLRELLNDAIKHIGDSAWRSSDTRRFRQECFSKVNNLKAALAEVKKGE